MSEHALNREQFGQYLPGRDVNPHQLALPGMEEHAHPFATHLARGYVMEYGQSGTQHHLTVHHMEGHWPDTNVGGLDWSKENVLKVTGQPTTPGEVEMVHNWHADTPRGRGLAGAMFHSAHYFNFGQSTVPIHSPIRSAEGKRFSEKVRPDLNPDVWRNYHEEGHEERAPGKPPGEAPKWGPAVKNIHPFQKLKRDQQAARTKRTMDKADQSLSGQMALGLDD